MNRTKLIYPVYMMLSIFALSFVSGIANAQYIMSTNLKSTDVLAKGATQDPYCDGNYPSFNISGLTDEELSVLCPRVPVTPLTDIPDGVVDWVLIELRIAESNQTAADAADVIARKPAFLLNNGRIVDAKIYAGLDDPDPSDCSSDLNTMAQAGCPEVEFGEGKVSDLIADKHLYLAIRHRNHLDIISASNVTEKSDESGFYTYDFTMEKAHADGTKFIDNAVYAMFSGDADGNNTITSAGDFFVGIQPNIGADDYKRGQADTDLSGLVASVEFFTTTQLNVGQSAADVMK